MNSPSPARPRGNNAFQTPTRNEKKAQLIQMDQQIEHERQVNDVMNEIEDQLDDSDDEDTSYLVNANASTGGAEKAANENEYAQSYYPEEKNNYQYQDNYNQYNNTTSSGYDSNNYSNQYDNGMANQDYQNYAA